MKVCNGIAFSQLTAPMRELLLDAMGSAKQTNKKQKQKK
jgi:hypothetical protein